MNPKKPFVLTMLALWLAMLFLPGQAQKPSGTPPKPGKKITRVKPPAPVKQSIKVWVNTKSGVYHFPGMRWYGTTKQGEYMTEEEAKKRGYRPTLNGQ